MVLYTQTGAGSRASKLVKSFFTITKGDQQITNSHSAKLYLQGCKVYCEQKTAVKCVEVLIYNPPGVPAVERAVRADLSADFITSTTLPFIHALSDPGVASLNDGRFLRQLLSAVLEPATFWSALLPVYYSGGLDDAGHEAFAWLCLQIVSDQSGSLDAHQIAVQHLMEDKSLLKSQSSEVRKTAYRIEKVLSAFSLPSVASSGVSPGGRHDNDHADFRKISIYPTSDELLSTDEPYLQRLAEVFDTPKDTRGQVYRDWLFRLLREDMLSEIREDLQTATGQKKSKRKPVALGQLRLVGLNDVDQDNASRQGPRASPPYTLNVACNQGIYFPKKLPKSGKKGFLEETRQFMKHDSFGALCCGKDIVAFGSLVRDIHNLTLTPPVIGIRFTDDSSLGKTLDALRSPDQPRLKFLLVDTATFAYEPILKRLKTMTELRLEDQLIDSEEPSREGDTPEKLAHLIQRLKEVSALGLKATMPAGLHPNKITLEGAQLDSFINGLSQELALIQGPPGTGKSFLGALILMAILRLTKRRILVLSYTNHALDQFMEDLMDMGASPDQMVRLGSKFTDATRSTLLREYDQQKRYWLTPEERTIRNSLQSESASICSELEGCCEKLSGHGIDAGDIIEYLEFSEGFTSAWAAFQVPYD